MKKTFAIFSAFVLFASLAYSQQSCGIISDEAGRISNPAAVNQGASALQNQGADPHVITVANLANYGGNAAGVLNAYLRNCRTWATASGQRNANLIVVVIAPKTVESFYGRAYDGALGNGNAGRILASSAVPLFKSKQFGEGVGAAFKDYAGSIAAFHDQAIHPVQKSTTIINQATDPKTASAHAAVWIWFFVLLFLAIVGFVVFRIVSKRNDDREEAVGAQQNAQSALQTATRLFRSLPAENPEYSELSGDYMTLTNSVTYDPNTNGLSASQYATIAQAWNTLANDIRSATRPASRQSAYQAPAETEQPRAYAATASAAPHANPAAAAPYAPATAPATPYAPSYQPPQTTVIHEHHTTYVERDNSGDLLTGMLIGESLANSNREYDRPSYRQPEYQAPTRYEEPSRSNDDDDRSSGSVSFGSSNDDDNSGGDSGSVSFDSDSSGGDSGGDSGSSDF
jgi:uncharacterized membrane protein YgcG